VIRLFGKDFPYRFTPFQGDEQVRDIPAHTAKALIYSQEPSRSQVIAEEGAEATYTAEWVAGAKHVEFQIAGIPDPDPSSDTVNATYFIAIKFRTDSDVGEGEQLDIFALPLARPGGTDSELTVTIEDCRQKYSKITTLFSPEDIETEIANQISNAKVMLKGRGFGWAELVEPSQLKSVIAYSTIAALMIGDTLGSGDKFSEVSAYFKGEAEKILKQLNIAYDASLVKGKNVQTAKVRGYVRGIR